MYSPEIVAFAAVLAAPTSPPRESVPLLRRRLAAGAGAPRSRPAAGAAPGPGAGIVFVLLVSGARLAWERTLAFRRQESAP